MSYSNILSSSIRRKSKRCRIQPTRQRVRKISIIIALAFGLSNLVRILIEVVVFGSSHASTRSRHFLSRKLERNG